MLTDTAIKKAMVQDKPYKLADGNGLLLEIAPSGGKRWRYRYRIDGKENLFALGEFCAVLSGETEEQAKARMQARRFTLSEERVERERCRGLVKQGVHPVSDKNNAELRQKVTIPLPPSPGLGLKMPTMGRNGLPTTGAR